MRHRISTVFLAAALSAGCTGAAFQAIDGPDATFGAGPFASRLAAAVPGEGKDTVVGARAGLLFPGYASDEGYYPALVLGAFYPNKFESLFGLADLLKLDTIPYELGLDFIFHMPSYDGQLNAGLLRLRMDCLFSKWGAMEPKPDFYVLGGLHISTTTREAAGESVWGPDIGVGLAWPEKSWDARLTMSLFWGSKNVLGIFLLTGSYAF